MCFYYFFVRIKKSLKTLVIVVYCLLLLIKEKLEFFSFTWLISNLNLLKLKKNLH